MTKKHTLEKLSDIIPLAEQGMTLQAIASRYGLAVSTIWAYARKLRQAGYTVPTKKGARKKLKL